MPADRRLMIETARVGMRVRRHPDFPEPEFSGGKTFVVSGVFPRGIKLEGVGCLWDATRFIPADPEPAPSWATEELAELMSKAPAICAAVRRLIAGSFRRDGERLASDACPRFSIPCRPDHDDDVVVLDWIAALVKAPGLLPRAPASTTDRAATLDDGWWA